MTTIIRNVAPSSLTSGSKIAAVGSLQPPELAGGHANDQSLYLIHYSIRAVISPLILAPKRNPQHIWVTASSVFFNLLNGYCMGSWIASDPVGKGADKGIGFWLLVGGWAIGLLGNGKHPSVMSFRFDRGLGGMNADSEKFIMMRSYTIYADHPSSSGTCLSYNRDTRYLREHRRHPRISLSTKISCLPRQTLRLKAHRTAVHEWTTEEGSTRSRRGAYITG
jgi:hypothetical protein